ncbi:MAG TPA: SH3 domain-containing protein, partial [Anaerolineaceae bacterium]|nr:SH3 domain-containing protein [Anaerolineaceae bacterium]
TLSATATQPAPPPTATLAPTNTPIPPTATPRPTATQTATPEPLAVVSSDTINLRTGPGTIYGIVGVLEKGTSLVVLERTASSEWFHVRVADTGMEGWVSEVVVELSVAADTLPLAAYIPPTPSYVAPTRAPVQPTAGNPTAALIYDAHIHVINSLSVSVTITLDGPIHTTVTVAAGSSLVIDLPAGGYYYYVTASGFAPLEGNNTWDPGEWEWEFYEQ